MLDLSNEIQVARPGPLWSCPWKQLGKLATLCCSGVAASTIHGEPGISLVVVSSKALAMSATLNHRRIQRLSSSPGRSPCLGPPRNRMWGFPPSGSSADVSCDRLVIV
jgi:hypothetical protein